MNIQNRIMIFIHQIFRKKIYAKSNIQWTENKIMYFGNNIKTTWMGKYNFIIFAHISQAN